MINMLAERSNFKFRKTKWRLSSEPSESEVTLENNVTCPGGESAII